MKLSYLSKLALIVLSLGASIAGRGQEAPAPLSATPLSQDDLRDLPIIRQLRPLCPVRLGGVFTLGLGDGGEWLEPSGSRSTLLSRANTRWIGTNCDVAALPAVNLTPAVFPTFTYVNSLFTPLLFVYASTLHEQPYFAGSVGGWRPSLSAWTLKDEHGREIPHPSPGGHWMDFASTEWALHWRDGVLNWVRQYGAQGVVASELPLGNSFVGSKPGKYKTLQDRGEAQFNWLRAARDEGRFLMIPSSLGFEAIVGKPTQPPLPADFQPDLAGRYWDHFYPYSDGAWCEGWLKPHWSEEFLPEDIREIQLQAADRTARSGKVFIAAAAYSNDSELEFIVASYLMVYHKQGRLVLQPMPQIPFVRSDAGLSLKVFQNEVKRHAALFQVPLGAAVQERHQINTTIDPALPSTDQARVVWRRAFSYGVVYVNSDDKRSARLLMGSTMRRVNGERLTTLDLPPRSGAILLFDKEAAPPKASEKLSETKPAETR